MGGRRDALPTFLYKTKLSLACVATCIILLACSEGLARRQTQGNNEMKVIAKLEITTSRPEEMRVVEESGLYLVQTLSVTIGRWITQAEHTSESGALTDCLTWY